jgi:hypothetical protein
MKTQILLISFLCMFAWSVQAQVQQHKSTFPSGPEKASFSVNPPQPGFKPDHMVVPAKRNMFDSSGYVWKWDTIFCYKTTGSTPYYRVTRKYNSAGDSIVQLMEIRQSSFVYVNYARESFTFDSAGNWLTYLSEKWENNAWLNQNTKKFVYNSNGDMVDWKETWWQNNRWMNDWHYYNHFDANGLNDTSMQQQGQDSLWVNYSLYIQSYDTNGYRISAVGSSWINNGWSVTNLDTFTYTSNGELLTYLRQLWENSSWVNSSLSTMTLDTAGNRLFGLNQQWQNNAWENNHLSSYLYDGNGNNILYSSQGWSGGAWVNQNRMLYLYDTSNNLLSQTSQQWDNSYWENGATQQYTYDSWGNSLTGKYLWWYQNTWQPYDGGLSVFADYQRDVYINLIELYRYEAVVDSILVSTEPDLSQGQVTLYPNPAHTMVYISSRPASTNQSGSLTIYDLRGQLILTKQVENETTGIDVSGLKPGVYFVRFSDSRMTRVMKLVKE